MRLRPLIACAVAILMSLVCRGQQESADVQLLSRQDSLRVTEADDFVTASILVASPSDVLYSCAGHVCIRMQCSYYGMDYVFSYESEPVKQKILTFLRGKLHMGMTSIPTDKVLADYAREGRGVTEYVLNIPLDKRKQLWQRLDERVAEGMNLPYDYLNRGCALATFRLLCDAVQPDTLSFAPWDETLITHSRYMLLHDILGDFPWNRFIIRTLAGTESDRDCDVKEKVVTRSCLLNVLNTATLNDRPVLNEAPRTLSKPTFRYEAGWFTPMFVAFALLLLSVVSCFWLQHPLSIFFLVLQSALGILLTYLVIFSSLPVTNFSWLLLPLNPLPLLFWHWRRKWALLYGIGCIVWCMAMLLCSGRRLVDPAHIVLVAAFAVNSIGMFLSTSASAPSQSRNSRCKK